jgi:hypothetical protein
VNKHTPCRLFHLIHIHSRCISGLKRQKKNVTVNEFCFLPTRLLAFFLSSKTCRPTVESYRSFPYTTLRTGLLASASLCANLGFQYLLLSNLVRAPHFEIHVSWSYIYQQLLSPALQIGALRPYTLGPCDDTCTHTSRVLTLCHPAYHTTSGLISLTGTPGSQWSPRPTRLQLGKPFNTALSNEPVETTFQLLYLCPSWHRALRFLPFYSPLVGILHLPPPGSA